QQTVADQRLHVFLGGVAGGEAEGVGDLGQARGSARCQFLAQEGQYGGALRREGVDEAHGCTFVHLSDASRETGQSRTFIAGRPRRVQYNFCYNVRGCAMKLKITAIGNSAGVILPKELLACLRLGTGDELYALETPDGVRLTAFDPELAVQMEVAEEVMRKRRTILNKLAQ